MGTWDTDKGGMTVELQDLIEKHYAEIEKIASRDFSEKIKDILKSDCNSISTECHRLENIISILLLGTKEEHVLEMVKSGKEWLFLITLTAFKNAFREEDD